MKIIKEFDCTTQTTETETHYNFKAVKNKSCKKYQLIINGKQHKRNKNDITSRNKCTLYYDTKEELITEFEYQYSLCKGNLFTKEIVLKK